MHLRRPIAVFAVAGIALAGLALWGFARSAPVPSFEAVRNGFISSEATLLDRHGKLVHELRLDYQARRLNWVALPDIASVLPEALVRAEDRRFWQHRGVDWRALAGAVWQTLRGGRERGASTLSMQLAAKLDPALTPKRGRRGVWLKLKQMHTALRIEAQWHKSQILEAYLNLVSYRGEWQGLAAASRALFDKTPSGLTTTEAWLLVALLAQPGAEPARAAQRACLLSKTTGTAIACSELHALAAKTLTGKHEIRTEAAWAPHLARQLLSRPGERVTSTLDGALQRHVAATLAQQLRELDARNVRDAAAVVVDNASGDVLAYVGAVAGRSRAAQVDGARALRQAGSTLKPFLYGLAIERRYLTAASLLEDSPVSLETGSGFYVPQNYERDYKGLVSVRTALASSLNIPAVRTLVLTGLESFRDRLNALGYEGVREAGEYYGYSLALGSAEVSLLEQVNAYRTLAQGGVWSPLKFTSPSPCGRGQGRGFGEACLPNESLQNRSRRVMSEEVSFIIADILSDRAARAVTFGLESPLATRYWSAVKTGTSKDMRDNWCIGFTPGYTVGVWVGNFEGDSMLHVSGVSGAAPAWLAIMDTLHRDQVVPAPAAPPQVRAAQVRFDEDIEPTRREWFIAGTELARVAPAPPGALSPRIESPAQGLIVALDPDIPDANQHVVFRASTKSRTLRFELNGKALATANRDYLWAPLPGRQTLALVGADGKQMDRVEFEVRATP